MSLPPEKAKPAHGEPVYRWSWWLVVFCAFTSFLASMAWTLLARWLL